MECPKCGAKTAKDPDYIPSSGIDPMLERRICTSEVCEFVFYYLPRHRHSIKEVKRGASFLMED
jgi:hypothetical protein